MYPPNIQSIHFDVSNLIFIKKKKSLHRIPTPLTRGVATATIQVSSQHWPSCLWAPTGWDGLKVTFRMGRREIFCRLRSVQLCSRERLREPRHSEAASPSAGVHNNALFLPYYAWTRNVAFFALNCSGFQAFFTLKSHRRLKGVMKLDRYQTGLYVCVPSLRVRLLLLPLFFSCKVMPFPHKAMFQKGFLLSFWSVLSLRVTHRVSVKSSGTSSVSLPAHTWWFSFFFFLTLGPILHSWKYLMCVPMAL